MLDYAASTLALDVSDIRARFESRCQSSGLVVDQVLAGHLGPDADAEDWWSAVKSNLGAGRIRLLFAADVIPMQLQRIVEFLNEQMQYAEVLAVEIKRFIGSEVSVLVPRIIGQTSQATEAKSTGRPDALPTPGSEAFRLGIETAPEDQQPDLQSWYELAKDLEQRGLATLWTTEGHSRRVLNIRLPDESVAMLSIYHDPRGAMVNFRRDRCCTDATSEPSRRTCATPSKVHTGRPPPSLEARAPLTGRQA